LSGGEELVSYGGVASGTIASAGGTLLLSGGVADDTVVRSDGF
jgi:hypothetical protein